MKAFRSVDKNYRWSLTACVVLYGLMLAVPLLPAIPIIVPGAGIAYLVARSRWLFAALSLLLPPAAWITFAALRANRPEDAARKARIFLPLSALPLSFGGFLLPGLLPLAWTSNLLFFLPIVLLTWTLLGLIMEKRNRIEQWPEKWIALGLLAGLTLAYGVSGWTISRQVGEHAVDEGHYLIQAASLHEDGDLDIRNNFGFDIDEAIEERVALRTFPPGEAELIRAEETRHIRAYLHISEKSQGDRWYSWHPYGLALLLAPTMGAGLFVRQLLLGFIAAIGCATAFLICMRMGLAKTWSLVTVLLFSFSTYWFVYAVRALPEALGATLFAGAVYAAFLAHRAPIRAFALLVSCCAFMPLAHPRFLPCAGLAGLYFYARAFFLDPLPGRARTLYLLVLAVGLAGMTVFLLFNHAAYASFTAYPLGNLFGVYPEGAWLLLFSERGLFFAFPGAVVLLIGTLFAAVTDRAQRAYHLMALAAFFGLLISIGMSDCWDGGPTMYGRYLLVTSLVLVPGGARLLERTSSRGRGWIILLGLYSAAYTFICLARLDNVGAAMLNFPHHAIRQWVPQLQGLFLPYRISDIMTGHPYHGWQAFTVNPFPLILLLTTLAIVWPGNNPRLNTRRALVALLLLVVSGINLHARHGNTFTEWSPQAIERTLATLPFSRTRTIWADGKERSILPHANRFADFTPRSLTSEDLGLPQQEDLYSQPRLDANDWEDRGFRWFTLVTPFKPGFAGTRAYELEGRIEGEPTLFAVVKQGRHVLLEQEIPIRPDAPFRYRGEPDIGLRRGDVYLLFRLEGEGTVHFDRVGWTPLPLAEKKRLAGLPLHHSAAD